MSTGDIHFDPFLGIHFLGGGIASPFLLEKSPPFFACSWSLLAIGKRLASLS